MTNVNHWNEAMLLKTADWYHSFYLWSIVSMAAYLKAQAGARVAKEILFVAKAIDSPNRPCLAEHYEEMLQILNINSTKKNHCVHPFPHRNEDTLHSVSVASMGSTRNLWRSHGR